MATPIGDERTKGKKAISRPQGGWFARIWTERSPEGNGSSGSGAPEKIRLGRSEPFTIWTRGVAGGTDLEKCSGEVAAEGGVMAIPSIPSRAFTIWTRGGDCALAPEEVTDADASDSSGVSPLPEAVFADVSRPAESRAFTLWMTGEAFDRRAAKVAPQEGDDERMPTWQEGVDRAPKSALSPLLALAGALVLLLVVLFFAAEKNKEANRLSVQIGKLKKDRKGLRAESAGLATALQGERTQVAESGRQLQATKAVGEELTSQRDALRTKVEQEAAKHAAAMGALGEKFKTTQRELAAAEAKRSAEGKEREKLAAAKAAAEKRVEDLQAAMSVEKKRHAQATKTAVAELGASTAKRVAAEAEAARLGVRLAESEKEIDVLNAKIAKMKKSEAVPADGDPVPEAPEAEPEPEEAEEAEPEAEPDDEVAGV